MSKLAVEVKNLNKTYFVKENRVETIRETLTGFFSREQSNKRAIKALDNINFEVKKGEFFGIIGKNGSGKSTLLNVIMGAIRPDDNSIVKTNGKLIRLALGMGFDPNLSARDNVYINASILGLTFKRIGLLFDDIIGFAELEKFVDVPVKHYSKGMMSKLKFAIAMYAEADIFLIDEFFGGVGDQSFKKKSNSVFENTFLDGRTILQVSHNLNIIAKHSHRAMLINHGKQIELGSPDLVIKTYKALFAKKPKADPNKLIKPKVQTKPKPSPDKVAKPEIKTSPKINNSKTDKPVVKPNVPAKDTPTPKAQTKLKPSPDKVAKPEVKTSTKNTNSKTDKPVVKPNVPAKNTPTPKVQTKLKPSPNKVAKPEVKTSPKNNNSKTDKPVVKPNVPAKDTPTPKAQTKLKPSPDKVAKPEVKTNTKNTNSKTDKPVVKPNATAKDTPTPKAQSKLKPSPDKIAKPEVKTNTKNNNSKTDKPIIKPKTPAKDTPTPKAQTKPKPNEEMNLKGEKANKIGDSKVKKNQKSKPTAAKKKSKNKANLKLKPKEETKSSKGFFQKLKDNLTSKKEVDPKDIW